MELQKEFLINRFYMKLDSKETLKKALFALTNIKNRCTSKESRLYVPVSGIGDGILFTAVAKAIYLKEGKKLLVSHRQNELYKNNPYIETIDGLYDPLLNTEDAKRIKNLGFDIIYPSYFKFNQQNDKLYIAYPNTHIIAQTASRTGFIGNIDIKPEIYLSDEEKKFGRFSKEKKQIVIMSTAVDKHKQYNKWQQVVNKIKDKFYLIQIGSPKDKPLKNVDDRRGKFSLRECASVLYNSDLFVGQIGGLMHMARAVDCPAVIAYSSSEPEYFDKYICNVNVYPQKKCDYCVRNNSPYSTKCNNNYCCVKSISVEEIVNAIYSQINKNYKQNKQDLPFETMYIDKSVNVHFEYYEKRYSQKLNLIKPNLFIRMKNKIKRIIKYVIYKVMHDEKNN